MLQVCVGHKPPIVQASGAYIFVGPASCGIEGELIVPEDCLGETFDGKILSEYLQLFWITRAIKNGTFLYAGDHIHFFQYRKFISEQVGQLTSKAVPYSSICSPLESVQYFPTQEYLQNVEKQGAMMISRPLALGRSIAENYARHHFAEDFSAWAVALSLQPDFPPGRVDSFMNCPLLIPSPSLSVVKGREFVEIMVVLERVWKSFFKYFYKPRQGYQRRVGGFLLERLHSFLVVEAIARGSIRPMFGHYFTVVCDGDIVPTV